MRGRYTEISLNFHIRQGQGIPGCRSGTGRPQFAPFAALTGFGAVLRETERITEKRIELDEYEKEKLDEKIRLILEEKEIHPEITVTFFVPDEKKDGGAYVTASGHIKRVDEAEQLLILEEGDKIPMEDIYEISRV